MPPASVEITRPLEWMDTDAAGIWHYSTTIRFIEHAELELHRRLDIVEVTFGNTPRARLEIDFRTSVRFGDDVTTTLAVAAVGRTSITYAFTLQTPRGLAAEGRVVTVLVGGDARPLEVPEHVRKALLEGGTV
ncbi:acyl-CoA thioesterase [Egicoccus sp. AB-alg2]|uniref:acyl-CoA thioesterase n=1 Tax=Egicoccus sp. AB-alg2 TaxID=3242693 RepID=UPI00359E1D9F